jgi:hypothetical protein
VGTEFPRHGPFFDEHQNAWPGILLDLGVKKGLLGVLLISFLADQIASQRGADDVLFPHQLPVIRVARIH